MAKGRKFGSDNRRERFLGSVHQGTNSNVSEMTEEDVWSMIDDRAERTNYTSTTTRWVEANNNDHSINDHGQVGGLSLAFKDASKTQSSGVVHQYHNKGKMSTSCHMAQSAPINLPDWSKIYRVDSVESLDDPDSCMEDHDFRMPPHEYLARENARKHMTAATSVLEGVGRTLKGRDMSRVRDAVWNQTGFYG